MYENPKGSGPTLIPAADAHVWRFSIMTLWTGFKQQHSAYAKTKSAQTKKNLSYPGRLSTW